MNDILIIKEIVMVNMSIGGKLKISFRVAVALTSCFAMHDSFAEQLSHNELIVRFEPTAAQQKLLMAAKNYKETISDLKIIQTSLMQKLPDVKLKALSLAVGQPIIDFAPYVLGGRVIKFKQDLTKEQMLAVISRIKKLPGVAAVQENSLISLDGIVTLNSEQWELNDKSYYHGGKSEAYKLGTEFFGDNFFDGKSFVNYTGKGVVVAVLDSGYTPHPNFITHLQANENGKYGYTFIENCVERGSCPSSSKDNFYVAPNPDALDLGDFISFADTYDYKPFKNVPTSSSSWHGTHVAGIIIGQNIDNNSNRGGAPDAMVVPVRISGKGVGSGAGRLSDIIAGMLWAGGIHPTIPNPHPAKVLNMSFSNFTNNYTDGSKCPDEYQKAFDELNLVGVTAVVTAGNNSGSDYRVKSPAICKDSTQNVVTVAALTPLGYLASYSNGGNVTIAASGGDSAINGVDGFGVWTTEYNAREKYGVCRDANCFTYSWKNGTSMAAPLVVSAIADMLSANPSLRPEQIRSILVASARPIPAEKHVPRKGKGGKLSDNVGRLDAIRAVEMAKNYSSLTAN